MIGKDLTLSILVVIFCFMNVLLAVYVKLPEIHYQAANTISVSHGFDAGGFMVAMCFWSMLGIITLISFVGPINKPQNK